MPTFPTPDPITASVELVSGSVHVVATDRDDTVVQVRPRDPNRASDVRIAEERAHRLPERHTGRFGGQAIRLPRPWRCRHRRHRTALAFATSGVFGVGGGTRRRRVRRVPVLHSQWGRSRRLGCREHQGRQRVWRYHCGGPDGGSDHLYASGDATVGELIGDVKFRAASGSLSVAAAVNAQPRPATSRRRRGNGGLVQTGSGESKSASPRAQPPASTYGRVRAKCATAFSRRTGRLTTTKRSPCT